MIANKEAFDETRQAYPTGALKAAADAESARLESVGGKERLVSRSIEAKGMSIVKPSDQLTADLRKVGKLDARRVAEEIR